MFAFDYSEPLRGLEKTQPLIKFNTNIMSAFQGDSISKSIVCQYFPLERNQILVRFTNLADMFDEKTSNDISYVNVEKWATELFRESNPGLDP